MRTLFFLALCSPWLGITAQHLVNDASRITVPAGTYLNIPGDVTLQNNSTLTNNGHVAAGGDWTELNAASGYSGTGWLWFSGSGDQQFTGTPSLAQLRVNNGNDVMLSNDLTITGSLDLMSNGRLQLGNNDLTLSPGASLSNYGTSGYIKTDGSGTIQQTVSGTAVTFPIGNSAYNPATLTNAGTSDVLGMRVSEQVLDEGTSGVAYTTDVVNRSWHIEEATAGGSNVTLTVQWNTSEEASGFDRTSSGIAHYTGGDWSLPGSFSSATANGLTWQQTLSGITSFSPFSVVDNGAGSLFPVEWLLFTAERVSATEVRLDWATASELSNAGFSVERKLEHETDFQAVGWVKGNGTTSSASVYTHRVADASTGRSWYRLRQVDANGATTLSETREVTGLTQTAWATLFPNPTQQQAYLQFTGSQQGTCLIQVVNATGQILSTFRADPGITPVVALPEVQTWAKGVYLIRVQHEGQERVFRLIKT